MQNKVPKQIQNKIKDLSIIELVKANSMLSKNCLSLSDHINKCELDIQALYHQNLYLKHEIADIKGVIEFFAMKIGIDKDIIEKQNEMQKSKKKIQKTLPLHDDLTIRCPMCEVINNNDFKICHKCGFKNNKNKKRV